MSGGDGVMVMEPCYTASASALLKRFAQESHYLSNTVELSERLRLGGHIAEPDRDFYLSIKFGQGSTCNSKKLNEFTGAVPTSPFGNV